jgi:serralysin
MKTTRLTGMTTMAVLLGLSFSAHATFHLYKIDQIYSNADGSVQFIDFIDSLFNDQDNLFSSQAELTVTDGTTTHTFFFPNDLPSTTTANTHFLVATPGYTATPGTVTADYILPTNNFLFTGGGTIDYFSSFSGEVGDHLSYGVLPVDGVHSINRNGSMRDNLAINFAGNSGVVPIPEPTNLILLDAGIATIVARVLRRKPCPT